VSSRFDWWMVRFLQNSRTQSLGNRRYLRPCSYLRNISVLESRFWTEPSVKIYLFKRDNQTYLQNKVTISKNTIIKKLESLEGPTNYKIESAISILKCHREDEVLNILMELKKILVYRCNIIRSVHSLIGRKVRKMAEIPSLIKFGSHTKNHKFLLT